MTETKLTLRLATTAIAAVLAISATPLLAQDAPPADTSVEPLTAPDPLAPAATTEPIVPTTAAPEVTTEAAPVATETRTRTTRTTTVRRTTAARPAARSAPAAALPAVTSAPAIAEPAPAPLVADTAPIALAEPVAVEPAASREAQTGVFMAIAAAAAVLAALIATLVALRRRRARREELFDDQAYATEAVAAEPVPAMTVEPEPAIARTVEPAPAIAESDVEPAAVAAAVEANHEPSPEIDGPVTELPEGFDVSRFGPNVQAAYNGPTEDNPSLSLKHRLRRASGMDQMATREAEAELAAQSAPVKAAADRAEVAPASHDFMLGGNGTKAAIRRAYSE